jgi:hypothetical protein
MPTANHVHDDITADQAAINKSSAKRHLNTVNIIENKPPKLLWNIGPHLVCVIDKQIVDKLNINEGYFCEQQMSNDGNIVLKIKRI